MHRGLLIAALVAILSGAASLARADTPLPPGWTRVPPTSVTVPAGALCPFSLQIQDVKDEVITKVLQTFPDGSPRSQIFIGELITRFTNVSSGASVTRNLSGDGFVRYGSDGSSSWTFVGPAATVIFPGSFLAPGFYVVNGFYVIDYAGDGTQTIPIHEGPNENLCETLR